MLRGRGGFRLFCYHEHMTEVFDNTITAKANDLISEKYANQDVSVHAVDGGYSRNRRAIIEVDDKSIFAKEVDVDLLPDEGPVEIGWLKKDYEITRALRERGLSIVPEWGEIHMNGHLLLMPSYKKEDGWWWSLPDTEQMRTAYIQAVIDATKQLETVDLPEELTETLSLQPFFRDAIAYYDGIAPIIESKDLRAQLIDKYTGLKNRGTTDNYLAGMYAEMIDTLQSDKKLTELKALTLTLAEQPNDRFNHCDVRSDNIAYNQRTGEIKLVDWNWASYAPAKFGATEFLVDMARRGVDITPWQNELNAELVAATVGYYILRSLKEPLTPGNNLRDMQAQTAAVANYLYNRVK